VSCSYKTPIVKTGRSSDDRLEQGLQTFLSEGHISCCTTCRGPGILRNVIVLGYVAFYQVNRFFVTILFLHCWQNVLGGRGWNGFAGRNLETPGLKHSLEQVKLRNMSKIRLDLGRIKGQLKNSVALSSSVRASLRTVRSDDSASALNASPACALRFDGSLKNVPPFSRDRCVVWTGDEKVFFFNPTTRLSMWERPEELKDRTDVDRILADPPHKRKLEPGAICDHTLLSKIWSRFSWRRLNLMSFFN